VHNGRTRLGDRPSTYPRTLHIEDFVRAKLNVPGGPIFTYPIPKPAVLPNLAYPSWFPAAAGVIARAPLPKALNATLPLSFALP
jgi:hypothetical protein